MEATRRQFLQGALGVAVCGRMGFTILPQTGESMNAAAASESPYGSGNFGVWIEDEFQLPAFRYTMNQKNDPRAFTDVRPGILGAREHIHQVGNDRITALASNYGHVRLRQDEGCPKLLNDVDPEMSQFGGGLGYLTDGNELLSTYYSGDSQAFERIFGVGYYRKKVAGENSSVDQIIMAPFGDDPVLISQTTITNRRDVAVTMRWVEYWGCEPYQFSYRATIDAMTGTRTAIEWRREMGRRFGHKVTQIAAGKGLLETKHFDGRSAEEVSAWTRAKEKLRSSPMGFDAPVQDLKPGTYFESVSLPQTFLVSLDEAAIGFTNDAALFFGSGGPAEPSGLSEPLNGKLDESGTHTGLFIERTVQLEARQSQTLTFLYGYLPQSFSLDSLIAKYEGIKDTVLAKSCEEWRNHGMRFEVASEPWVKREATWNHYYLRSGQTYDDFFDEHILNQNGFYQYTMGFQGAVRDPLQHSLPFLFSDPEIVRSILRYTLKEVRDDGSVPYGIVGHGVVVPMLSDKASDLPLWLLWVASEYVLATRDTEFLQEEIPAKFSATPGRRERVDKLLERCFRYQVNSIGVGRHGVMRMLVDDWNDGLIYTWAGSSLKEAMEEGESVLNSAMAAWVFQQYARMLDYAGADSTLARKALKEADRHRAATQAQWNGRWFKRAWLGHSTGWVGESTLWVEPQPWAILAGATTDEQSRGLIKSINDLLRNSPLGTAQMSDGPDMRAIGTYDAGTLMLGSIWPSLNQTLVWALARIDPAMAWDEWKRNTLASHAENYPDLWYGVWSGNDSYNSLLNPHPGAAVNVPIFHGTDFPVLNPHSHACSLYGASKLLGLEFTPQGMKVNLTLPLEAYRFDSPLVGVVKQHGRYEGWYAPSRPGTWTVEIAPPADAEKALSLEINGKPSELARQANGTIVVRGSSSPDKPLRWALRL